MGWPRDRSVTIKDVAADARVAISTVSAVLNESKYVSPDLVRRVQDSIDKLGYQRNILAQGLKQRISYTIGLIIPDIGNPFFTDVVRGVEDGAHAKGYALILGNSDEDPAKERAYIRMLERKRADGFVFTATADSRDYLASWPTQQLPLVTVDRSLIELGIDGVLTDNVQGARRAVEHLVDLGHRRVGMISGRPGMSSTDERLAGYREALQSIGLPNDPTLVAEGPRHRGGGSRAAHALLSQGGARPTALFVSNGQMTIGALEAIRSLGLRCPHDVALVGFDDFEWSPVLDPPLTTVRQPGYEMGRRATQLLFDRLAGSEAPTQEIRLAPELIIRESCGAGLRPRTQVVG